MEKLKCKECGNELHAGAKFCEECGTKVENEEKNSDLENLDESEIHHEEMQKNEQIEKPFYKKKWFWIIAAIAMILIFVIIVSVKGNETNNYNNSNDTTAVEQENQSNDRTEDVVYIGARSVDFQEETKEFRVFFHLLDSTEHEIDASGVSSIKIVNDNGETVYDKDIEFTSADFTTWTYQTKDDMPYMACLYIPVSDIMTGTTEKGTMTLEVTLKNGCHFDSNDMIISGNLPLSETTITLPSVPATYKEYNYKNEVKYIVEVQEVNYELENCYDGEQDIKVNVVVEMKNGCESTASTSRIGYSLTDSDGIVVDSGTIYNTPLFNGETTKSELNLYDLKVGENYTLKLIDAK